MTSREYPHSERDNSPFAGAGSVPAGVDRDRWLQGLPTGAWHLVGPASCACGARFADAGEAARHLAASQFDRSKRS